MLERIEWRVQECVTFTISDDRVMRMITIIITIIIININVMMNIIIIMIIGRRGWRRVVLLLVLAKPGADSGSSGGWLDVTVVEYRIGIDRTGRGQ